jgi:hypothetical protein
MLRIKKASLPSVFLLIILVHMVHPVSAGVVMDIKGFAATYPAGLIGGASATGIPTNYFSIPAAREYYLDYRLMFESGWQCVKGGKLPGLVGGTHTTGCNSIVPNGWSARFMWVTSCKGCIYLYHQNRRSNCGDNYMFSNSGNIPVGQWVRITERVVINTPGQNNGIVEAWYNGAKVVSLNNIQLRGNVSATTALVDCVSLQTFYGGSTNDWAPSSTTHSRFSVFHVRSDLPDFSLPFDTTYSGTSVSIPSTSAFAAGKSAQRFTVSYLGKGLVSLSNVFSRPGSIDIYTPQGRMLRSLSSKAASHWDGKDNEGNSVRPGVLLIHFQPL